MSTSTLRSCGYRTEIFQSGRAREVGGARYKRRYNLAPTGYVPTVVSASEGPAGYRERQVHVAQWGSMPGSERHMSTSAETATGAVSEAGEGRSSEHIPHG